MADSENIRDLNIYLKRMERSVMDKMFFIDKVFEPIQNILDFGCANGGTIKSLELFFGDYRYIGYDVSEEMVEAAKKNVPEAEFYTRWEDISLDPSQTLINISSTVHEVYSYSGHDEIEQFWDRVWNSGFKYVSIRDMSVPKGCDRDCEPAQLAAVRACKAYAEKLREYESVWGPIVSEKQLTHFLLKYSYTQNWAREVRENYLPISTEALLARIPDCYEVTWLRTYTLPYVAWQVERDFGVRLSTPTHIQLICKKREA